MCQRTLRETMLTLSCGDRERLSAFFFLLGNSPILLHASPFPFFHTNVCCWISDSQLLPSALLLHHTPMLFQQYSQEIAPKRKNENRRKKKKLFLVTHSVCFVLGLYNVGLSKRRRKAPVYTKASATAVPQQSTTGAGSWGGSPPLGRVFPQVLMPYAGSQSLQAASSFAATQAASAREGVCVPAVGNTWGILGSLRNTN